MSVCAMYCKDDPSTLYQALCLNVLYEALLFTSSQCETEQVVNIN